LKPLNVGVRAPERDPALAQRLHLRAREHHPGLVALEQVVLMPGTAVVRDHFLGHGSIVGSDQGHSG